jgi:hypothetical protein
MGNLTNKAYLSSNAGSFRRESHLYLTNFEQENQEKLHMGLEDNRHKAGQEQLSSNSIGLYHQKKPQVLNNYHYDRPSKKECQKNLLENPVFKEDFSK